MRLSSHSYRAQPCACCDASLGPQDISKDAIAWQASSIAGCDSVRHCAQATGVAVRSHALGGVMPCGPLVHSTSVSVYVAIPTSRSSFAVSFYVVSCLAREPAMSSTCVQLPYDQVPAAFMYPCACTHSMMHSRPPGRQISSSGYDC